MTREMKFTLTLDGRQFSGTLQEATAEAKQFTDTTTAGANRANEALKGMGEGANAAAAGGRRAGESLRDMTGQANAAAAASTKAGDAIRRMTQVDKLNAARDILDIRSFHAITREIAQVEAAYKRLTDSGKLSAQELGMADQARQASIQRLKQEMQGLAQSHDRAGMSAGQHAQAMHMLPMQMTDVAVSIASGMPVWMVAIQQGGQLKDAFGGIGAAARATVGYVVALVSPLAVLGASLALLALAHEAGAGEQRAFDRSLIMTGGRLGLTSGQLSDMAAGMDDLAGVTRGQASEALAVLAGQAGITSDNIERIAATALRLQAVGGPAVEETAKAFASLAKSPLSASIQLNEQTGHLTQSVYRQIRALEAQGRTTEAAKVAQEAYAAAMQQRIPELERNLGTLEKMWKGIATGASEAWDAMLNVGREKSTGDKIAEAEKKLADLQAARDGGGTAGGKRRSTFDTEIAAEQAKLGALREQQALTERAAATKASEAASVTAEINGDGGAGDKQRAIASAAIDLQLAQAKAAADGRITIESNKAAALDSLHAAGLVTEVDYMRQSAAIGAAKLAEQRKLIEDQIDLESKRPLKADDAAGASQKQARLVGMRAELAAVRNEAAQAPILLQYKIEAANLSRAREDAARWAQTWQQADDLVKSLADQTAQGLAASMSDPLQRAQAQADLSAQNIIRSASKSAREIGNEADILRGQAAQAVQAQNDLLAQASAARSAARAAELRQLAAEQGQQAATASGMAGALQERLDKINAGAKLAADQATAKPATDGAASAEQRLQAMRDEMAAVELVRTKHLDLAQAVEQVANARLNEARADATARGQTDRVAAIEREIAARQKLGDLTALRDYLGADVGTQIAAGFDSASQSMAAFVRGFGALMKVQEDYGKAKALAGTDTQKLAAVESKHAKDQVAAYGTMLGAAKGFFREGSKDWANLQKAEQAFRAAEMAMSVKSAALKMGLISEETAAKLAGYAASAMAAVDAAGAEILALFGVGSAAAAAGVANQAQGDPYSALPRMAGMAAVMAGLGFVVGGLGGGSGGVAKTNTGTGTVLGDKDAKSESIKGSLDALKEVDLLALGYSAQMAASLRNIETRIGGVSSLLARSGRLQDMAAGIKGGYSGGGAMSVVMLGAVGAALSAFTSLGAKLFGTKTTVQGQGITGAAQSLGEILANGTLQAAYYADVEKKRKFLGATVSTKVSTQLQGADAELERQFGSILSSFAGSVRAAAVPLGVATDAVEGRLRSFVVDIGKIDLRGLTGEQVSEKLSAVFGAVGDNLARAALAGFDEFQAVGEGYLETVVRVASATESAGETLRRLGIGAVSLASIDNKQGDVGAELVRQSIAAVEAGARGTASSLGQIISTLSGTAQELADTYSALVDVRGMLRSVGIDGQAVTADLIRGAGGLSALKDGATAYEEKFLTAAEQTALKTSRMTAEFARLGVTLPTTAADFRRLVEGASTSTAAGQAQLGGLLALSTAFSDFIEVTDAGAAAVKSASDIASERASLEDRLLAAQGNTAALRARELAKLDASNRALQTRVWALEDEKKAADALAASGKGIAAFLDELRGAAGGDASVSARRATYQADLASAQAGDTEASGRIVADARALIEAVKATASDPLTLARETSRIAAQLDALPAAMAYAAQQAAAASAPPAAASVATTADPQNLPPADAAVTAVPVVIQQAAAPVPVIVPPAPFQPQEQDDAALLAELRALRAEVAALRQSSEAQGAVIATNTGRTSRVLEAVTQDGDAITTRAAR